MAVIRRSLEAWVGFSDTAENPISGAIFDAPKMHPVGRAEMALQTLRLFNPELADRLGKLLSHYAYDTTEILDDSVYNRDGVFSVILRAEIATSRAMKGTKTTAKKPTVKMKKVKK